MPNKIKIIHIIGRLQMGGAERLLYDLCRKIDKQKFNVQVVSVHAGGTMQKFFKQAEIKVTNFHKTKRWDFAVVNQMAKFLREEKPDIVHTHLFAGDFWGGMAARRAGVRKIISTRHDILKEDCMRDFLGKRMRQKFTKVIAISKFLFDHLVKEEKIDFRKIQIIHNGIDMSKFYDPDHKILKTPVVKIGTVGRLSKEKGQKHLLRAGRFLRFKNWQMTLVGEGDWRKKLEHLVHRLDVEDKVKFIGEVEDVTPYLKEMDVFVLPSVSEGLSLSLLEAAAAGCFVIATRVGGIPEVVQDDVTGKLFQPKNIEQLEKRLSWVERNPGDAREMAVKLREEVRDKFSLQKMAREYEKMYLSL